MDMINMTSHLSSYDQTDLNLSTATLELTLALPGTSTGTTTSINNDNVNKLPPAASTYNHIKDTSRNRNNKRSFPSPHIHNDDDDYYDGDIDDSSLLAPPASKAAVVGWPPIRSYMKNNSLLHRILRGESSGTYVKVSMDGVPYLRKIDLKLYNSYTQLFTALGNMFKLTLGEYSETQGYINGLISEYAPTYQDKDGDWMLLGDVPWEMFIASRKIRRLRMMKGTIRS